MSAMDIRKNIRTIADYPEPGIMFRDITTLLADARSFRRAIDELVQPFAGQKIDKVRLLVIIRVLGQDQLAAAGSCWIGVHIRFLSLARGRAAARPG